MDVQNFILLMANGTPYFNNQSFVITDNTFTAPNNGCSHRMAYATIQDATVQTIDLRRNTMNGFGSFTSDYTTGSTVTPIILK